MHITKQNKDNDISELFFLQKVDMFITKKWNSKRKKHYTPYTFS